MVIYFTGNFTGVLEYIKETFWMLPVSIIKKKKFRGLSNTLNIEICPLLANLRWGVVKMKSRE